ncbi:MAG: hypothetical protein LBU24_04060 [Methanocalculaceae archaeon]|nr:hypothetical protein [Methanocalculaceae archaeon]
MRPDRFVEFYLVMPPMTPPRDAHAVLRQIEITIHAELDRMSVKIHLEPCDELCDRDDSTSARKRHQ